jgi:hypothetical protein
MTSTDGAPPMTWPPTQSDQPHLSLSGRARPSFWWLTTRRFHECSPSCTVNSTEAKRIHTGAVLMVVGRVGTSQRKVRAGFGQNTELEGLSFEGDAVRIAIERTTVVCCQT